MRGIITGEDRELSFWGWGYADKFPDDAKRRELADLVAGLLDVDALPLLQPPRLDEAKVAPPRLEPPQRLAAWCTTDAAARVTHTYGRAYRDIVRGFHGNFSPAPDVVAMPRSEDEVALTLKWASAARVAVIPYGGGTSVVGGVEAALERDYRGVVSLDLSALDRVLEVDETSRLARIQAGATGPRLEEQLATHGLTLRHYPQSFEFSTLGGWIATRAGGHYATRWTRIDDFVASVRMLTPHGAVATRRLPASGAGPDANRFILGSEGTLGVITEAWMRVQRKPVHRARATVHFSDFHAAVASVRAIVQSGLTPANCRLLDANEALLNRVAFGTHVLLLGFESADHPQDARLAEAVAIARTHGGEPEDAPGEGRGGGEGQWRRAFLDAPYLFNVLVSVGVLVDTFETAVTWDAFPTLHATVTERVTTALKDACGAGFLSCRFTHAYPDGVAPYYTFLAPAKPGRELDQWAAVKRAASDAVIEAGGTITHHHAVGRVHRPWYEQEAPPEWIGAQKAVKREWDPADVMNPGALLP